jgi:hypothetical protein
MKKTLFSLIIHLFSIESFSQEYSFSAGPSWGVPFYYQMVTGGPSKSPKTGLNANFEYIFHSDRKISWGAGIGLQDNKVELKPEFTGSNERMEATMSHSNVLYLTSKMVFRKRNSSNFSLDPLIGFQTNKTDQNSFSKQSGVGLGFSFVKKINLNQTSFLKIEPKLMVFNIIPFESHDMAERMTSLGLNIGYGIKKL